PLLEIVSAPDLNSAKEAVAYLKTLHTLVRYIEISSANMQEGAFRCDANVSMRPAGNNSLGTRVEIKNLNSFRFVEQAINYEVNRQTKILEQGGIVKQETRFFNAQKKATWPMRIKEEAEDYRYFPDPDLLPLKIEPELIAAVEASMPELPAAKQKRFMQQYGLSTYTATLLATDRELADYFEKVTALAANPKLTANWILGELAAALNRDNCNIKQSKISAEHLADLIRRIADQTISEKIAKLIFVKLWNGDNKHQTVDELITKKQLAQINDKDYLNKIATNILTQHQKEVKSYQAGKKQLFSFFVGQIIQATNGKANPAVVNQLLHDMLF
ncbi:MAG: Asp-tRNA(Asn)/Glu-tRNA(Gln) amidotransferase subunit GatB, partial [Gammaproteobacteria bacterium]|nr:Asp-tRNA(Asn)/Glu-tRNA(Gln) amidotransferase subunit GatB [Gammaproteobacteria bacterium]